MWLFAVWLNAFNPSLQLTATDHCSSVPDLLYAYAVPVNFPYIPELYPTSYIRNLPRYPRPTFYINSLPTLYPTFCYTRCLNLISRPTAVLSLLTAASSVSENVHTYVYVCVYVCACMRACANTRARVYTHMNTYTHTHTCIHTYKTILPTNALFIKT